MMSARGMNAGISIEEMSLPSDVAAAAMTTLEFLLAEDDEERPLRALRAAGADVDTLEEAPRRRRARAATGRDDEAAEVTAFIVGNRQAARMFGFLQEEIGGLALSFHYLAVG